MKQILGIIPARYASTRFPGKPLALIANKPMIQWVYERSSPAFGDLCVATDDDRISAAVKAFGGRVVMTSPTHSSGTERCREALDILSRESGKNFTHVVNIQGDEPLISEQPIHELLSCFDLPGVDIATLVQPLSANDDLFSENLVKVVTDLNFRALYFSRAPIPWRRGAVKEEWTGSHSYLKHIGIYAYRSEVLREIAGLTPTPLEISESLEQLRWIENGKVIQTRLTAHESLGVDTPGDLEKVVSRIMEQL